MSPGARGRQAQELKKEQTGGHSRGPGEAGHSRRARGKQGWGLPPGRCPLEGPGKTEPLQGEGLLVTGRTAPAGRGERVTSRINSRGPWRPAPVQLSLFLQGSRGEFPSVTGSVYDFISCTCATARDSTQSPPPHPPHSPLTPRVSTAQSHPASPRR